MLAGLLMTVPLLQLTEPSADGFQALAERVRFHTLANGLRLIVLPYGEAPVASFHLYVRVGSIDEERGRSGLAHFAEHMAFKGSARIGSRDWEEERRALEACDAAWRDFAAACRDGASGPRQEELLNAFTAAQQLADAASDAAAFDRAMEEAGGRDSNASTGADSTSYYVSLPATRVEHWFWLAREQIEAPVMREFYKERDVVMEERRMRSESNPYGAAQEALLGAAFSAHPYGQPTIGHMDDLTFLDRPAMMEFWRRHYSADRMVIAVVGGVDAEQVFGCAERYLGGLPRGAGERPRRTCEPEPPGERIVIVRRAVSPMLFAAWPVPPQVGRDGLVHGLLGDVLAGGSYSRAYRRLVKEEQLATAVYWVAGFPGRVDPTLLMAGVVPAPGRAPAACLDALQGEIERLARDGPTARELAGARRRAKLHLLRSLEENEGLAEALAEAEAEEGGWRNLFQVLAVLDGIEAGEVAAAATELQTARRTVCYLLPPGQDPGAAEAAP